MKIAILMSTYNGEKYLVEQIESIIEQSIKGIDIWIRDDGSTDNTRLIIEKYKKKYDNIIALHSVNNLGPAKSFLRLLYESSQLKYDYYAFCDQDDVWKRDKMSRSVDILSKQNLPCIYFSNAELVNEKLESLNDVVYHCPPCTDIYTVFTVANILGCTMVLNNALVNIISSRSMPDVVFMHDSFVAKACLAIGGRLVYDNYSSMKYRQHSDNVIGLKNNALNKIKNRIGNIITHPEIGISNEAEEILKCYEDDIALEHKDYIAQVASYNKKLSSRLKLSLDPRSHYISLNKAITIRLSILFGNQ